MPRLIYNRRITVVALAVLILTVACGENSTPDPTSDPQPTNHPATPTGSHAPDVAVSCMPEDADESLDVEGVRAGLECTVELFTWPEGKVPNTDLIADILPTENARFRPGIIYSMMAGVNECAWAITWLEARRDGDAALEAEALDVMTNVVPNYVTIIPHFPETAVSFDVIEQQREIAERASLGDPTAVQLFVDNNCGLAPSYWGADS